MEKEYILSPGPHVFSKPTTKTMMRDVMIGLLPVIFASIYFFRVKALIVLFSCVVSCVGFEFLFTKITKRKTTIKDLSAVLTGLLLALVLPPGTPFWACAIGALIAIVLTKQIFGGLGFNIFNPALLGRAFLMAAFPTILTTWTVPVGLDAVTSATPLGLFKFQHILTGNWSLFTGGVAGSLGETSSIALILGGVYLLIRKVIDFRIPSAYILTVFLIALVTNLINPDTYAPWLFHVLSGGLLLGAIFMATDPVTSPVTKKGRWVFGIGCGLMTMIIRLWAGLPEGVMYSIILMNAFTPLINRTTKPRRYGT